MNEGKAIISGGVMMATTPAGMSIDQLFIEGRRQHMARYPDFDPNNPTAAYQGFAADAMETNIIRDSRWRCDHGRDVDLDDGSSNHRIYQNLVLAGGFKLRDGGGAVPGGTPKRLFWLGAPLHRLAG